MDMIDLTVAQPGAVRMVNPSRHPPTRISSPIRTPFATTLRENLMRNTTAPGSPRDSVALPGALP